MRRRNAADMQELEQDLKDRKAHDGNTWFVQLPERIEFLGRIMVHKTDWLEYRLSIHPETGRLWAGKGDMPPEYALQLCWSLACALTDPPCHVCCGPGFGKARSTCEAWSLLDGNMGRVQCGSLTEHAAFTWANGSRVSSTVVVFS